MEDIVSKELFIEKYNKYYEEQPETLKAKQAVDVANKLIKIFLQFGAPAILQSDNGREFVNKVIEEFKVLWPQLHIVHGRPRHPQSQGSVERANQDVENMLRAWMTDNHSTSWATGCYFVQWQKNNSLHRVIGRSPFKAVFGSDPKLGLASTNLPQHILSSVATEEELNNLKIEINSNGLTVDSNEDELADGD
ncbi:KRAB-A domain-containing protein 2-like, partial [Temnothorax curvispinosus]|uniref:KRAB-A domain-containing protein 2-like n=1 Tax=Temnothorax curvispinosus TaxID=300111 RepID=A0A6J1R477_9HYME